MRVAEDHRSPGADVVDVLVAVDVEEIARPWPGAMKKEEFARVARAALQQCRCRIAIGIDLHRIDRDAGCLDVIASLLLPGVDRRRVGVPAVLGVEAVAQQDDDLLVLVIRVDGRDAEGRRRQRLPAHLQADRLIGIADRLHGGNFVGQRGPIVAQA